MITLIKTTYGRPLTDAEQTALFNFQNAAPNKSQMMNVSFSTVITSEGLSYRDGFVNAFDDATVAANYTTLVEGFTPAPLFVQTFVS